MFRWSRNHPTSQGRIQNFLRETDYVEGNLISKRRLHMYPKDSQSKNKGASFSKRPGCVSGRGARHDSAQHVSILLSTDIIYETLNTIINPVGATVEYHDMSALLLCVWRYVEHVDEKTGVGIRYRCQSTDVSRLAERRNWSWSIVREIRSMSFHVTIRR